MSIQYNVPIKILDNAVGSQIASSLRFYKCFTDESGNFYQTCLSREQLPYVGEMVIIKTLREDAANTAHKVLSEIEGLIVLPITESNLEDELREHYRRRERVSL